MAIQVADLIETTAIAMAVGNNGGVWAEHYTEAQKDLWRRRASSLVATVCTMLRPEIDVLNARVERLEHGGLDG